MPVRRRKDKKRTKLANDAWDMKFHTGYDYLEELSALGIPNPLRFPLDSEARIFAEKAWDAATREAWARLGSEYMRRWEAPRGREGKMPWAYETYGPPEDMRGSNAD